MDKDLSDGFLANDCSDDPRMPTAVRANGKIDTEGSFEQFGPRNVSRGLFCVLPKTFPRQFFQWNTHVRLFFCRPSSDLLMWNY
jgi:hypothetical protein